MLSSIATAVIGQSILLISGVLMARTLGPDNRGVLALVFVLSTVAVQLGGLGVPTSLTYWIAAGAAPRALLRSLRGFRHLQLVLVIALHAGLIVLVLQSRTPSDFQLAAFLSLAATAATLSQMYGLAVLQGCRRFGAFNVLRTAPAALTLLGVVTLYAIDQATLTSITLILIGAAVVSAAATSLSVMTHRRAAQAGDHVSNRAIISFGLRSLFGSSSPMETFRLEQLIIGVALSPVLLGYYVVAAAFTNLTRFIGQSIGMVTYPRVAGTRDPTMHLKIIRRDFALATVLCGGLTLVLVAMIPTLLPFFFGSAFRPAIASAQILLLAALFAALRRILVDGTRGTGRPLWGAVAELATLIALPLIVLVAGYTDSLAIVSGIVAAANFAGLLIVAPALVRRELPEPLGMSNLPDGLVLVRGNYSYPGGRLSTERDISLD